MIDALRFIRGAVSKKPTVQALSFVCIENSTVRAFNGSIALCSPIALDLACKPHADTFLKALACCDDQIDVVLVDSRLKLRSGKFRATIECLAEDTPHVMPEGNTMPIDGEALIAGLTVVEPFIGEDASRPWCGGVLFKGGSCFATNNIIVIEYWCGLDFGIPLNIPDCAVQELLRIKEVPTQAQSDGQSITFHYPSGRWLRAALLTADWPDVARLLNTSADYRPICKELFDALETLAPFTDKMSRVYIEGGSVRTSQTDTGAAYEIQDTTIKGSYNSKSLMLLKDLADDIDFSTYPRPCLFRGDRLRGALTGYRS